MIRNFACENAATALTVLVPSVTLFDRPTQRANDLFMTWTDFVYGAHAGV